MRKLENDELLANEKKEMEELKNEARFQQQMHRSEMRAMKRTLKKMDVQDRLSIAFRTRSLSSTTPTRCLDQGYVASEARTTPHLQD